MLGDEQFYLKKVDKTLERLRALFLGQETHLTAILPPHILTQTLEEQAKHITEQIIFALAKTSSDSIPADQLTSSRIWLQDVTLYLLTQCNKEDQTFKQLKHLIVLPQGVRDIFFSENLAHISGRTLQGNPPALLKELDGAIWYLLNVHGITNSAEYTHNKAINLLL